MTHSPFDLQSNDPYLTWRDKKLASFNALINDSKNLFVDINNIHQLSDNEKNLILARCDINSFCLYRVKQTLLNPKDSVHLLGQQLGIHKLDKNLCSDDDKLTSITHTQSDPQKKIYIPYSNKELSWHTDGYYNTPNRTINSMLLHCQKPAKNGGVSFLLDHEIAYILLRDESPDYIEGLMQNDAMTIPANIIDGEMIREEQSGPVFSINTHGQLHMRFSARKRNIEWKQSSPILEAVAFLNELMNSDSPYIIEHKLNSGEGLVCRNILHCRSGFVDYAEPEEKRLLYRGRYKDHLPLTK